MPNRSHIVSGLDIGTTDITVVTASVSPGAAPEILGVGRSPSRGMRKGVVINVEATVGAISEAVRAAETMSGVRIGPVHASLSGSHVRGFDSHGVVGIRQGEVTEYDVRRVLDAARAVAVPTDREVIAVLPQEYRVDDQDGIKEPIGISGVRLETRVHIVTGSAAGARNVVNCANRAGLRVADVVLSAVGSAEAVLSQEEKELGVLLVDLGGGTSDIVVYQDGAVRHTAVIPVGGNHVTNDIAAGLRTPVAAAEEIKRSHASAVRPVGQRDETIDVPAPGDRGARGVPTSVLAGIVEPRVSELFNLIHRELVRAGVDGLLTGGVVLTGGSASLRGVDRIAELVFDVPVRIGKPVGVGGLTEAASGPEFATVVGLVKYGAAGAGSRSVSEPPGFLSRTFGRVGNWFREHF